MTQPSDLNSRLERMRTELDQRGQAHVLRWWNELTPVERFELLADIDTVPWPAIDAVMDSHIRNVPKVSVAGRLEPAPMFPAIPRAHDRARYQEARRVGTELLRSGAVAAFTVAGGQGTRLGVSGPKGMVAVTPVRQKTLFQLFAEMVLAAQRSYDSAIPWYIMTSPANHEATQTYFAAHHYFGLPIEDVVMFPQGTLPAFDLSGRLLMDARHRLSLAPDGHGGSLKALVQSGAIAAMRRKQIRTISYFQVDNPLVQPFDPLFLGLHTESRSEMSTKVARKAHDLEKVGNLCLEDGRLKVIEYSEMPDELAQKKNDNGSRMFDAANLAIHLLEVEFVERVAGSPVGLPLRRAEKAIPFVSERGDRVLPSTPNAVKLETFVFDVLPLAKNPILLEVDRAEEFSPVKNASGPDSLETSQRDQIERAARWLEHAGVAVARGDDRRPREAIEISPLFALDRDMMKARAAELPPIKSGQPTYIE